MADLVMMIVKDRYMEVAKNALKKGMTIEFVMDITGLDEALVKQLQEELNNE